MKSFLKIIFILLVFNFYLKANNENNLLVDILLIKDNSSDPDLIFEDAVSANYNVDVIIPDLITAEMVNNYRLVILSTGNNPNPCLNNNMRTILAAFVDAGGKVIIEGGQNGYAASVLPAYPAFKNKVLKILHWTADNGGDLLISSSFAQSNLANVPTTLSSTIQINFTNIYDQDVCSIVESADLFYKTNLYQDNAGILVWPDILNIQLINYGFNYSSVANRGDAKNLLTNSIYNLIGESVAVNNIGYDVPFEFKLSQNYPNPFNPFTTINYQLPKSSHVRFKVYDILGNEVETLIDAKQDAGNHKVIWNGLNFSSGIYFYTMTINGNIFDTKKMFLLK